MDQRYERMREREWEREGCQRVHRGEGERGCHKTEGQHKNNSTRNKREISQKIQHTFKYKIHIILYTRNKHTQRSSPWSDDERRESRTNLITNY